MIYIENDAKKRNKLQPDAQGVSFKLNIYIYIYKFTHLKQAVESREALTPFFNH